ncbi:MAG TPA: hypothetical protein VFF62_01140 [Candidatus Nitrosocosmicus sp.]|jgi:hypothetical protein|nr:hypothetical protein [Candidatus Nitrosocosmicus sp.]
MRHLDAFRGPLSAFAALSALLLVLLGLVVAPAVADSIDLDANGAGTAIGAPTADPNVYTVTVIATGHSAVLGKFRVRAHHFTDVSTGTFLDGAITFEGAQGRLFGTYGGSELATGSPEIFTLAGTITFLGGTGRFAGATGEADFSGELHITGISPGGLVRETVTLELHGSLDF